ncbi:uncharacterized protein LOC122616670 isoform X2 [Drosophila teissieri]|uniref:uncharacterized protein LOC122616670 isoform X2 n=1 Tax=Drosophila teissieri TaxID=7243 RepID=UPI001CBA043A|nr:uncharacterized protein LOC122616670 isoform X2 [Drosophila teissieri]
MYVSDEHRLYRRARRKFSFKTYGLLVLWLVLALAQWLVIALIESARKTFRSLYYICLATFALAIVIFGIFIFVEKMRFIKGLNFIMSLIIVELQIVSTFALVALSWWADVLTFFAVALILVVIFLVIGVFLPSRADLTLDIAVLFILAFIFLIVASFILLFELLVRKTIPYAYSVVEISVTFMILLFVMYHGQTINGNRFAEMRLNDFFLGSLILFHDFLIIFWLTFYWQIHYRPITPNSWLETSTPYYNSSVRRNDTYKSLDGATQPPWGEDWFTRGFDDGYDRDYPEMPSGRGKPGNRNPNDRDPIDGHGPSNRGFTKDWSVYNQRPKNGFRSRGRSRTKSPEPKNVHHRHRKPEEWDPEYITQGVDMVVPFDDRYGENSKEEEDDEVHPIHNEDTGPIMEDDDRDVPINVHSEHPIDKFYQNPNTGPEVDAGNAEGKSAAGFGDPTVDFPPADYQPIDDPSWEIHSSTDSSHIYIIPKARPSSNQKYLPGVEDSYSASNNRQNYIQREKIEDFTAVDEKSDPSSRQNNFLQSSQMFTESGFGNKEYNLQKDEMSGQTGQHLSEGRKDFHEVSPPPWEELSEDEIRRIIDQNFHEDKYRPNADRGVEPLITREPYPINLADYEKLVLNVSSSILQ